MALTPRHRQELIAIGALLAGVFVALTLLPWDLTGPVGRIFGGFLWRVIGIGAVLIPLYGLAAGLAGFGRLRHIDLFRVSILFAGLVVLVPYAIAVATGAHVPTDFPASYDSWSLAQRLTGVAPAALVVGIAGLIGTAGAVIVGLAALSGLTVYTLDWHPFRRLGKGEQRRVKGEEGFPVLGSDEPPIRQSAYPPTAEPPIRQSASTKRRSAKPPNRQSAELEDLPPVGILTSPSHRDLHNWDDAIDRQGEVLIETLATFRVEGTIVGRTTGPVVTQYEVAPAPGVKVGRIAALADDLALAMRAQSIRIVAPIPGRGAVGVEVPNPEPRIVTLRELLDAPEWAHARGMLPIALGHNLEGKPIITDLARMPHLLIAGATGSGKSICINTIITSFIYRYSPRELRLLMIDPKMVELSLYNALPHLRHPVVTDNHDAAKALKWVMVEMERRYQLFHANGARGMGDFNRFVAEGRELVEVGARGAVSGGSRGSASSEADDSTSAPAHSAQRTYTDGPLPYIVLIVDELADLMMTVQGEVEKPLAILAQKARATGIHLILATQRPSVNVITGLIKANFPCRIAFRVASKVDSRTIIDQNGAEALLGNGDGLFLPPGKNEPVRFQGAYISTAETEDLTKWYAEQAKALEVEREKEGLVRVEEEDILSVVEAIEESEGGGREGGGLSDEDRDPLFRDAAQVCVSNQGGSTSLLQRKLKIGYGRAARIMDQLEEAGVLGPSDGPRGREVLIGMDEVDSL